MSLKTEEMCLSKMTIHIKRGFDGDGVSITVGKHQENSEWIGFVCWGKNWVGGVGVRFCTTMVCMSEYSETL